MPNCKIPCNKLKNTNHKLESKMFSRPMTYCEVFLTSCKVLTLRVYEKIRLSYFDGTCMGSTTIVFFPISRVFFIHAPRWRIQNTRILVPWWGDDHVASLDKNMIVTIITREILCGSFPLCSKSATPLLRPSLYVFTIVTIFHFNRY